jgi:hypothetical protein
MKVEIDLPKLDGFNYTGEFRVPKDGERYLGSSEMALTGRGIASAPRFILSEIKWEPEDGESYEYITSGSLKGFSLAIRSNNKDDDFDFTSELSSAGNCFPLGTITGEHLAQVDALIRSFGNEKT